MMILILQQRSYDDFSAPQNFPPLKFLLLSSPSAKYLPSVLPRSCCVCTFRLIFIEQNYTLVAFLLKKARQRGVIN